MKLPAYAKYKPSGVEWLGDVPEHWSVMSLRRIARLQSGEAITSEAMQDGGDYPVFGGNGIRGYASRFTHRGHHVLIGRQGALCGNVNYATGEFWASEHAVVVSPHTRWSTVWMGELLRAMDLNQYSQTAAQPGLSVDRVLALSIPVPPSSDQEAIACFLNRETAKIDALVAKKRTLIERLKEKRTALISRTVTRGLPPAAARAAGLDPNPKLKPSGIAWLGSIPAHWDGSRIKYVARIESGHTPSRSVDEYWIDCSIPWVSLNDSGYLRSHDYITHTEYQINGLGLANSSARLLPAGAVVFSRDATVGLCAITTRPMAVSQHFVAYLCGPRLLPEYLLASLRAMGQHLESLSLGATISTIGMDDVGSLAVAIPPLSEQQALVTYLGRATRTLDQLIIRANDVVQRLLEYRTSLITAAVTGKVDVRGTVGKSQVPSVAFSEGSTTWR